MPLVEQLTALASCASGSGMRTIFSIIGSPRALLEPTEVNLTHIAHESIMNVLNHAQATEATITIDYSEPDWLWLVVGDDGIGADTTREGFGLVAIQERVQLLDGYLYIYTAPGEGFEMRVDIPV